MRPTTVLTIGTFDLAHIGHFRLLQRAARLAEQLVVGVNTDEFAKSFKRAPVQTYQERIDTLRTLGYKTARNDGPGADLIDDIEPTVLAVGSDWARKDYHAQINCTQDWLDERGIIVAYIPYTGGVSTTELIRRISGA